MQALTEFKILDALAGRIAHDMNPDVIARQGGCIVGQSRRSELELRRRIRAVKAIYGSSGDRGGWSGRKVAIALRAASDNENVTFDLCGALAEPGLMFFPEHVKLCMGLGLLAAECLGAGGIVRVVCGADPVTPTIAAVMVGDVICNGADFWASEATNNPDFKSLHSRMVRELARRQKRNIHVVGKANTRSVSWVTCALTKGKFAPKTNPISKMRAKMI